jgi:hypothetical protein
MKVKTMNKWKLLVPAVCVFLALVAASSDASAYPVYRRYLKQVYGKTARCEACHGRGGGTERNDYGKLWAKTGGDMAAFKTIDHVDTDGDGFDNKAELEQDSNPADAKSTPSEPGKYRAPLELTAPTDQLLLVWHKAERMEVAEADLTEAQMSAIQKGTQRPLDASERFPTLYFGVDGGKRTKVALFAHFKMPQGPTSVLIGADFDGRVTKAVAFNDEVSAKYGALLGCLEGHTKENLPSPTEERCGKTSDASARVIQSAVRTALWTLATLGSARADAPAPEPAASALAAAPSAAASPTIAAGAPPAEAGLDFSSVQATSSKEIYSPTLMGGLALAAIAALLGLIALSANIALRSGGSHDGTRVRDLAASSKLLVALTLVGLLVVQAFGAADAYVQTHSVHESTLEYFQSLSRTRLCGMSHAHIFGYTLCYGFFAWVFLGTSVAERTRCLVVAALLWSGLFDVLSWWGIKEFSGRFEWLSATTGAMTASLSLYIAVTVLREMYGVRSSAIETHANVVEGET